MEELQAKHRKEQRDLQARITQKKKSATKKTRKGVNDECDRLQRELGEKQQAEISKLNGDVEVPVNLDDLTMQDDTVGDEQKQVNGENGSPATTLAPSVDEPASDASRPKKQNRQKARLARRAAEQEAEAVKAAEEAGKQTDHRGNERKVMDDVFARLGLTEQEVRPDGHCLYSAVAHRLIDTGVGLKPGWDTDGGSSNDEPTYSKQDGFRAVRGATSDFILAHSDDFAPFIEESLQEYARKIKLTTEWGGQLELQAIARAYGVHINVVQGDGRIEKFEPNGEEATGQQDQAKTIWLAYYRHTYGLGEHYNALVKNS